ncbi:RICIN domain-containing protein [Streptomyces tauricus]|uniref:RICIN domain-containing protein n=1 Tax=Streptomyces tauricus TaxID=68274 RepID=UPI002244B88A|nr:RICIN domain-containing protein [Streptomyces tauricus]MCW8102294.1 RICIN domain-containing protein [Streptomyces tauricus]
MTRSAEQPPASPSAGSGSGSGSTSGSGGEEAATTATAAVEPRSQPEPAAVKTTTEAGETEGPAPQGKTTEPEAEPQAEAGTEPKAGTEPAGTRSEAGADSEAGEAAGDRSEAEAEAEPGAAAAAKSRLPALVRTMTATAIDRPQQQTGPVGRPGKAVLAGAAVAGALLVSVPLLMLGGDDDKDRGGPASAGTVLGGNARDVPGEFAQTSPDTGSAADGKKDPVQPGKSAQNAATSAPAKSEDKGKGTSDGGSKKDTARKDTGRKTQPEERSGGKTTSGGGKSQSTKAGSGVTLSASVSLRSHLSGKCVDVPGGDFGDGKKLFVWDCNGGAAQKWQFASDGTIRIKGLCMDVANANYSDGTPIQIARCSGNAAQKFVLNGSHDLVNTVVGKCVDIKDNNRGAGAWLQLWSCAGTDNQKWSV